MPRNPIIIITLPCIVAVVAGYFLFQLGSARLAQGENRIPVEHSAVCKRIAPVNQEHCMGELNGLRGWHEQLRASIL